jgi:hypothetical protein
MLPVLLSLLMFAADQHYDLGGPCATVQGPGSFSELLAAKKSLDWNRIIELQRQYVREACAIQYRWEELAQTFIDAHRESDAVNVLEEMDARGFDVNPALIEPTHPQLSKFMGTPIFRASAIGKKVEALKAASDKRRARARELLTALPQRPPESYVAKKACPFECCTFREWTVEKDTELVVAPGSTEVIGKAKKGTRVKGLTGEVHLTPEPVYVISEIGGIPKGTVAFILDREGEGYSHVWTRGKVVSVPVEVAKYCFRPSESCWAEEIEPDIARKKPVWWVKVRLANGVIGWTDHADHFGNMDSCG